MKMVLLAGLLLISATSFAKYTMVDGLPAHRIVGTKDGEHLGCTFMNFEIGLRVTQNTPSNISNAFAWVTPRGGSSWDFINSQRFGYPINASLTDRLPIKIGQDNSVTFDGDEILLHVVYRGKTYNQKSSIPENCRYTYGEWDFTSMGSYVP